jgi:hypothetical protein
MFPLAVCQVNQWQHIANAALIWVVALLIGAAVAARGKRLGTPASIVLSLALSGTMPLAVLGGVWPFNGQWPDCANTPDPNEWVIVAALLSPFLSLLGLAGLRLLHRR